MAEQTIAFQGAPGAYSDLACRVVCSDMKTLPCHTFEDTFTAVTGGKARLAMIPIDNSVAGRVADIHHLLPDSGLHIIGEHFQRIDHHLLALPGTRIEDLTHVHSHVHALNQCRKVIRELGLEPVVYADTAAGAAMIADGAESTHAAIASELAGEIYGLESLRANIEDAEHNTTRFLIMARDAKVPAPDSGDIVTSMIFKVRHVPAALYKAMGGFATNGVNLTKLESYLVGGSFQAAQFYVEIDGHPEHDNVKLALEELRFQTKEVKILGVFPSHPFRKEDAAKID
ncbi:MAG: prephenate dehydratase [Rhodospirillaceae bacterium]|jgi:prephenate dehydratase|nr:prephenate dehydratase [Rhodospirillaceae bacterium]MBT4219742.1 prephenate dehydratase [Rhodospirillaceae bacterium]MBT4464370.1 prephenate dehydratase [Rhodospirillaceae bacterium]MBT5013179.1 prephenate dehydratase [Rhodospirillaceae bacterium]MBT5307763.1 prephenate dehydratase [Rhodospirillaceae bacterium]